MGNRIIVSQAEKQIESSKSTIYQLRKCLSEADRSVISVAKQNAKTVATLETEVHYLPTARIWCKV